LLSFLRFPELLTPLDVNKASSIDQFTRIRICDTREWRLDLPEDRSVAVKCLKIKLAVLKDVRDNIFHILFLNFETVFMLVECHFRFNHPEFDQMSSCL